jgi:SAM-dependent methyltransferase
MLKTIAKQVGVAALYERIASYLGMLGGASNPPEGAALLGLFLKRCAQLASPTVLELGTKRSIPERSTMHVEWVPHAREYVGSDISAGPDVGIVADVHELSRVTGRERFDVVISCSSFEHFKYPHRAAHEIMKVLKPGGLLFVQTHQSFPLHAYPYDYFRFSREALAGLFGTRMGFNVVGTAYEYPARIYSRQDSGTRSQPAYLNVVLFGEKVAATPEEYLFELG